MPFWIWLILGFVLLSFLGMFAATWPIAKKVYHNILVRTGPEKWTRANITFSFAGGKRFLFLFVSADRWVVRATPPTIKFKKV